MGENYVLLKNLPGDDIKYKHYKVCIKTNIFLTSQKVFEMYSARHNPDRRIDIYENKYLMTLEIPYKYRAQTE